MKLSHKKDVRRGNNTQNKVENYSKWKGFFLFKPKNQVKQNANRHKVVKIKNDPQKQESQKKVLSIKDYGITTYQSSQAKTQQYKKSGVIYFMTLASVILTISTLFYFYEVSNKIVSKKGTVIDLYKKYESIRTSNKKAEILLSSLEKSENLNGKIVLIIDTNNKIETQTKLAIKNYLSYKEKQENMLEHHYNMALILFALVFMMSFIALRIYLLNKEKYLILLQKR